VEYGPALVDALLRHGWLADGLSESDAAIAAAISALLKDLSET
jgi:hypothetical protein